MAPRYRGFDIDIYPGATALEDARAQGFSWCASYLPAPSHHDAGWPSYPLLRASRLGILPVWVGAQLIGPGSHNLGPTQGYSEGKDCVATLGVRLYPAGTGVAFDTENGAPLSPLQAAHLSNWRDAVHAGGYRPMVYGSYQNFDALAAIFGASNVWEFELSPTPNAFRGLGVQYAQEVLQKLAGHTYSVDLSVSDEADPAGNPGVIVVAPPAPPPAPPPFAEPPGPEPTLPPPPAVPIARQVKQAAPPIAAALTAAATAAAGAVQLTGYHANLAALVNAAMPYLLAGVILPGIVWIYGRLLQRFRIDAQSTAAQFVLAAVENAVRAEAAQAVTYIDGHATVVVHNQMTANVLNYVATAVPTKIAASGITPEQLANLISNRLAQIAPPGPGATQ